MVRGSGGGDQTPVASERLGLQPADEPLQRRLVLLGGDGVAHPLGDHDLQLVRRPRLAVGGLGRGEGDAGAVRADLVGNTITVMNPKPYQTLTNPNSGTTAAGNYYFNPANFDISNLLALDSIASTNAAALPYYTYGTFPRNGMRGPGQTNLDLTVAKHFHIGERMDVELRGDAFDVLNHAEFANPDTTPTDSTFGQISTTVVQGRILQLALHLQF